MTEINRDARNPYAVSIGEDYGHATAVLRRLSRSDHVERETRFIEENDFECRHCGARMRVTVAEWPKTSACEHSFAMCYRLVGRGGEDG